MMSDLNITPLERQKRVAHFALRSGLFWNNGAFIYKWVDEEGTFYHHNNMSAGEQFFEFLHSIGVLLNQTKGYRLAIFPRAIEGYAHYLIDKGTSIESFIDAIVCVGSEAGWLPITRTHFEPKFYEETSDFDCRQLLADLAALGYAEEHSGLYIWTAKMDPILKANFF